MTIIGGGAGWIEIKPAGRRVSVFAHEMRGPKFDEEHEVGVYLSPREALTAALAMSPELATLVETMVPQRRAINAEMDYTIGEALDAILALHPRAGAGEEG